MNEIIEYWHLNIPVKVVVCDSCHAYKNKKGYIISVGKNIVYLSLIKYGFGTAWFYPYELSDVQPLMIVLKHYAKEPYPKGIRVWKQNVTIKMQ